MKKLKTFNNNPNSRLFQVRYKPNSARGLFGTSKSSGCLSVTEPSNQFTNEQRHQKGDNVHEIAYSSEITDDKLDISCHGVNPTPALMGETGLFRLLKGEQKE